jgi:Sulfotransferase domain
MLIWLASYPRSGNTFLRILLNRLYGFTTTTGYDDNDPVAQQLGPAFVGYKPRTQTLRELVDTPDITFVKTHRQPHRVECGDQPAIYLVRDGRDAIVSFAHQRAYTLLKQGKPADVQQLMQELVLEETLGTGNWGLNVLYWLKRSSPTAMIRFEKLIREPEAEVARALEVLKIKPQKQMNASPPGFSEFTKIDGEFFRRGVVGSYRDEMPQEIQESFWKQPYHAEAMTLRGYAKD